MGGGFPSREELGRSVPAVSGGPTTSRATVISCQTPRKAKTQRRCGCYPSAPWEENRPSLFWKLVMSSIPDLH